MSTRATNVHRSGQIAVITATKSGRLPHNEAVPLLATVLQSNSKAQVHQESWSKTTYTYSGIVKCRLQQNVT